MVLTPVPQADGTVKISQRLCYGKCPCIVMCWCVVSAHSSISMYQGLTTSSRLRMPIFASSGLVAPSLIRLGFLAVVPRRNILGRSV